MAGNYQITLAQSAVGAGGLTGRGDCAGLVKYDYLPEVTTDAILAITGEELGLLATWTILLLFAYITWRGMQIAGRGEDRFAGLGGRWGHLPLRPVRPSLTSPSSPAPCPPPACRFR